MSKKNEDSHIKENRWDALYRLNDLKKQQMEEKIQLHEEQQRLKEEAEFSYKPKLVTKPRSDFHQTTVIDPMMASDSGDMSMTTVARLGVQERNQVWLENKQNKLEAERERQKNQGTEECTFAPKLMTK